VVATAALSTPFTSNWKC